MSVTYLIKFNVKPDESARFLTLLNTLLDSMRNETMFIDGALHVDPEHSNIFLLHETWVSHDDVLNVQLARPYRHEWNSALPELLSKEREISVWHKIRDDRSISEM
ncbi:putative quinol monooxygenase [Agrobacterium tumefaciens]|uniref:putative quinol monooxygenase n=1 Tax=Agrobacterium tumefaciens TaxID=358 RepID=UPI0021D1B868|nr:putative quinol monooxygenase [Agrobacterium tumefaciens]UXS05279.1 antibiotic biosynthesis monooxygenase [Agrobacterium tumefaciens]